MIGRRLEYLYRRVLFLSAHHGVDPAPPTTVFGDGMYSKRATVEHFVHELAHMLTLGLPLKHHEWSMLIADRIGDTGKPWSGSKDLDAYERGADVNETLTCAIEILAMKTLGIRVGVKKLAEFAFENMDSGKYEDAARVAKVIRGLQRNVAVRAWAVRIVRYIDPPGDRLYVLPYAH